MQEINITELRRNLPSYLKRVAGGEEIRITNRGRVLARIVPDESPAEEARKRLERLRGSVILGDILEPLENAGWTADADHL